MYIPQAFREDDICTLHTFIQTHESHFDKPWPFQLPDDYLQKMMRGIVGFEIEITRLEGKFKLSQNRTVSEQENVITALQESSDTLAVAELIASWKEEHKQNQQET
jgi:transcriptional regulator